MTTRGAGTDTVTADERTALRRRGAVILAVFALVWVAAGLSGVAGGAGFATGIAAGALVSVALAVWGLRAPARHGDAGLTRPADWRRRVGLVNLTEFAAIFACVALSNLAGRPELIPPAVCLVVGVHFLPLARLFAQPEYRPLGVALCVVAAAGGALVAASVATETVRAVVCLGAALCLWTAAAAVTVRR